MNEWVLSIGDMTPARGRRST